MQRMTRAPIWICLCCLAWPLGVLAAERPTTHPTTTDSSAYEAALDHRRDQALVAAKAKGPLLLHLPGIAGQIGVDRRLVAGLKDGGIKARIFIYDWTEFDAGIHALHAFDRNQIEAEFVARLIIAHHDADPDSPIFLTAHSGGCAIAVWALEKLPRGIQVDQVLLLAPALSPTYDLSAALRHVRGRMFAFTSTSDSLVLDTGTRVFGTMDGQHTEAAGYSGFVMPATADADAYLKLSAEPYQQDWMQYNNWGDHIGPMSRRFAAAVLAPLIEPSSFAATSRPSAAHNVQ
jgi:hypothetical protein